jgi:hypothetical protein
MSNLTLLELAKVSAETRLLEAGPGDRPIHHLAETFASPFVVIRPVVSAR